MRAIGVSLVAIATVAVSMAIARQRSEVKRDSDAQAPENATAIEDRALQVDQIRSAGW